jgi:hypothetical protein
MCEQPCCVIVKVDPTKRGTTGALGRKTMRARVLIGVVAGLAVAASFGSLPVGPAAAGTLATVASTEPQLVQATGATETTAATSLTARFSAPTVAGDLLVLSAGEYTGTTNRITSVTDSAGRSWVRIGTYAVSGHNSDGEMWYAANAASVTSVTARTKSSAVVALSVQEFSGVMTSGPLDVVTGTSASSNSASSGPVTPTAPGDLAVGFVAGHASKQAISVTAPGYATQPQRTSAASHVASVITGYRTVSTVSPQSFTGTVSTAMYWAAGVAMFRPAVAPPNDFSIAATPGAATVTAGRSVTFTVTTGVTSGVRQPVALSVTGLPDGAGARFSPSTVNAGEMATMTVSPTVSTAAGTTTLTIVGTGPSATRSTPVALTVNAPAVIRAAFYYPWYPDAWTQQGLSPFTNYVPTRGNYSTDVATVSAQIADMQYAGVTLGIASWFGLTSNTEKHWPAIMQAAQGTGFAWAPYYEKEGTSDPTPQQIADDLHYLHTTYGGTGSALASLPGKGMPVFVYNADDATNAKGCDTVDRWNQARQLLQQEYGESIYIDLKVFPQYATCAGSPAINGWHQYAPTTAQWNFATAPGDGSFTVSPGYWKAGTTYGTAPFLARDRTRWQGNIAAMNGSGAKWQLITTYNEWGEGTAIESSSACLGTVPAGTYCDWSGGSTGSDFTAALHNAPPPA